MYTPKNLSLWDRPSCYAGAEWYGYYSAGVGQHRDSDALERANFQAVLALVGGEKPDDRRGPTVCVVHEGHWAVGWVEWIAIRTDRTRALKAADAAKDRLAEYPVLDESLYSDLEDEDCRETWENCYSMHERWAYLKEHAMTHLPRAGWRNVLAAVRGDWHAAANILPYPSDLIA